MEFAERFGLYLEWIDHEIKSFTPHVKAPLFYDPISYVLNLKGKRIRPLLALLSAEAAGGDFEQALAAAAAVELLHDFTLVHDDIMDEDELRRGQPTVHKKWDVSTAILAGDGLMGLAFQKLLESPQGDRLIMMERMTKTMIIICEGQALDKTFEKSSQVSTAEYMDMIARKTAVLLELSCELGGRAVNAGDDVIGNLKKFGYHLGLAFQIQDDLLDIMASQDDLGKKVGSDLEMHKQTLLTIRLKEKVHSDDFYDLNPDAFRNLLQKSGVQTEIENDYINHFDQAFSALDSLPAPATAGLKHLAGLVRDRNW